MRRTETWRSSIASWCARVTIAPPSTAHSGRSWPRTRPVGVYRRFHTWLGRGDALADTWRAGTRAIALVAAEAVPDEVIDELCVHGSPEQCRAHIRRYIDHGVTTPVIALMKPDGLDLRAAIHALAPSP